MKIHSDRSKTQLYPLFTQHELVNEVEKMRKKGEKKENYIVTNYICVLRKQ